MSAGTKLYLAAVDQLKQSPTRRRPTLTFAYVRLWFFKAGFGFYFRFGFENIYKLVG